MWWLLAFASAALLGCYDSAKKVSLSGNAVIPVLFLNTVLSALIFSPFLFSTGFGGWEVQKYILLKSALVLSSWMAGYFAMKHLPLTIVGPVNATRPVLVLLGAIFLFGERLNALQWIGVALAVAAYLMLRASGRKEGIGTGDKWLLCLILAVILGAASGLYDKYLMSPEHLGLDRRQVLSWYTLYQAGMMAVVTAFLWYPVRKKNDALPLEMGHPPDQPLSLRGRLCLYGSPLPARRPHRGRVDDPPRQRPRELRHRHLDPQGEEPEIEGDGPGTPAAEHDFPVPRVEVRDSRSGRE